MKIGDQIKYTFPGIMLVHKNGSDTGIILKFSRSGRSILVESNGVKHWIRKDQIITSNS